MLSMCNKTHIETHAFDEIIYLFLLTFHSSPRRSFSIYGCYDHDDDVMGKHFMQQQPKALAMMIGRLVGWSN